MGRRRSEDDQEEKLPTKVTDIAAAKENIECSVAAFVARWTSVPEFDVGVEVMDARQLRDAMGLRASMDIGDPWPKAENLLLSWGFCWHWLGGTRVMFLREKLDFVPSTGWDDGEEVES
jgi:hypothetical protein